MQSAQNSGNIFALKSNISIFPCFGPLILIILIFHLDRFLNDLSIKLGKYNQQRNYGFMISTLWFWYLLHGTGKEGLVAKNRIKTLVDDLTCLSLFLYWRTQVLWIEEDEGCPLVYNTYEKYSYPWMYRINSIRYQIACNWFFTSIAVDRFSMNFQTVSISLLPPASKPSESWKTKLLPG